MSSKATGQRSWVALRATGSQGGGKWAVGSKEEALDSGARFWGLRGGRMRGMFMTSSRNYADLIAWQKAMDLVEMVYNESTVFPEFGP